MINRSILYVHITLKVTNVKLMNVTMTILKIYHQMYPKSNLSIETQYILYTIYRNTVHPIYYL